MRPVKREIGGRRLEEHIRPFGDDKRGEARHPKEARGPDTRRRHGRGGIGQGQDVAGADHEGATRAQVKVVKPFAATLRLVPALLVVGPDGKVGVRGQGIIIHPHSDLQTRASITRTPCG